MAAWSDLLDEINVFPVADADTGRNLKISLAPLLQLATGPDLVAGHLVRSATGNAGNIAAAFFYELLKIEQADDLTSAIQRGMRKARQSVVDPQPGTMLTVFDALAEAILLEVTAPTQWDINAIVRRLQTSVADSCEVLPQLKLAGVVDAGALGMFIFLETFLSHFAGRQILNRPVTELFDGKLSIAAGWQPDCPDDRSCVSATLLHQGDSAAIQRQLSKSADSVVVSDADEHHVKVHFHTRESRSLRSNLEASAQVVDWSEETIVPVHRSDRGMAQPVHIMTDAAGSFCRDDARALGVTLLSSYLVVGEQAWPETLFDPERLYAAMLAGTKVSTAQSSVFERHQSYLSAVSRYRKVLYLCVGSVYTGNFQSALAWKRDNDPQDRLMVIDTGTASGRLGIVVGAVARFARQARDAESVVAFAREAIDRSDELVFLEQLKYLARGGRISKTKGFFGDLLQKKPIITPTAHGAAKVGVVRNRQEQLAFAMDRLMSRFSSRDAMEILLQYSDNRAWVQETVVGRIRAEFPAAIISFRPLSLTSGAHMGPGTWALACLPDSARNAISR